MTGMQATAKFRLGRIMCTPNAKTRLSEEDISRAIMRHQGGDWGNVNEHDRQANERALVEGTRLWSVYFGTQGTRFWVITEADRSYTTVLLPEDY